MVKHSPYLLEVAREAEVRAGRRMLTSMILSRLGADIPKDIRKRIDAEEDFDQLLRCILAVLNASSFDELRTLLDS